MKNVLKSIFLFIAIIALNSCSKDFTTLNEYSSLRALEKFEKNKKSSLIKLLFIFPLAFLKSFIIKRGFLNGTRGFIAAINNSFYAFLKEAKLYELNNSKGR